MPSNTLLKQWDPSSSFKILEFHLCIFLSALSINWVEHWEHSSVYCLPTNVGPKEFWLHSRSKMLKFMHLCLHWRWFALSSEIWFEILVQKNFGWNLCIHVCIGRNRGGGSPFQVKFTKISYPRLSFQYTTFPSICKNE